MQILLDTNAFVWWVSDNPKLGPRARDVIASKQNDVYVSNLSLLECSIKMRSGKLKIDFEAVDQEISENRIVELRFDTLAARQFVDQKQMPHADPFDHALVAQAVAKHMTLITSDQNILTSTIDKLYVIDATR